MFRKESDTQFSETYKKTGDLYFRAKELYFANSANHMTMKKNGELEEYRKYHISKTTEHKWSIEITKRLIEEIINEHNILQVVQLSRVNLPENEILEVFEFLSSTSSSDRILSTIQQLKPLFEPNIYRKILLLFMNKG